MGEINDLMHTGLSEIAIVIPLYKENPTNEELFSFTQCLRIFKNRPVYIVCHDLLNIEKYRTIINEGTSVKYKYYDGKYFSNVQGYNKLLLSEQFYNSFITYEYILIYQLDAFVFSDMLDYWCKQGYDYIGAPWFENYHLNSNYKFDGVGNGGFSLRKVSSFLSILKNWHRNFSIKYIYFSKYLILKSKIFLIGYLISKYFDRRNRNLNEFLSENEDYIYGHVFGEELKALIIPDCLEASRFSFEVHANYLFELNHGKLPFGCHGWYKYNIAFWNDLIYESDINNNIAGCIKYC